MSATTNQLIERLLKDNIIEGKTETVLGDTAVKLMAKIHQIENGHRLYLKAKIQANPGHHQGRIL